MTLVHDEDSNLEGEQAAAGEVEEAEPELPALKQVAEISLNSVTCTTSPRTLKLKGQIEEQEVVVLVDPRATHNFISQGLVLHL